MQKKKESFIEGCWNGVIGTLIGVTIWFGCMQPLAKILDWNLGDLLLHQAIIVNGVYVIINVVKVYIIRRYFDSKEQR